MYGQVVTVNILLLLNNVLYVAFGGCSVEICHFEPWQSWNNCSVTCGGGYQRRWRPLCCKTELAQNATACYQDCSISVDEEFGYRSCNAFCKNEGSLHFDYSKYGDCRCPPSYYGDCCDSTCPSIAHCKRRSCTNAWDTKCQECFDENTFFKRTHGDSRCERMCAYDNHFCWPGMCSNDFIHGCQCASGFTLTSASSETLCQPSQPPSLKTCNTEVVSQTGKRKKATTTSNQTTCLFLEDIYGNFQPSLLQFELNAAFLVDLSSYPKPKYIHEYSFGVTDQYINISQYDTNDRATSVTQHQVLIDSFEGTRAVSTAFRYGNVSLAFSSLYLSEGHSLCFTYVALSGGYLKGYNFNLSTVSSSIPYHKIPAFKRICYRYDTTPPEHCMVKGQCSVEPIQLDSRITRSASVTVRFSGWNDPLPPGGTAKQASSVKSYKLLVQEVVPEYNKASRIVPERISEKLLDYHENSFTLKMLADRPRLLCISLEVSDFAENVRRARRFLLYDNSSYIRVRQEKPLRIVSASSKTSYVWQTRGSDICLEWKDHFVNQFYIDHELLNPIEPDVDGLVTGIYEQGSGILPVSGTASVGGITRFLVAWKLDKKLFSKKTDIQDINSQSLCRKFILVDGQTYTFRIQAFDIASNTFEEDTSVYIDQSVATLDITFMSDGNLTMLDNQTIDLKETVLHTEARDPHSGVEQVEWKIKDSKTFEDLISWKEIPTRFSKEKCSQDLNCYCPSIGKCESSFYTVPLDVLKDVHKNLGGEQRNYTIDISVTNNAKLIHTKQVDFVVGGYIVESKDFNKVPLLIGGVCGGTALLAVTISVICVLKRKRKMNTQATATLASREPTFQRNPKLAEYSGASRATRYLSKDRTTRSNEADCRAREQQKSGDIHYDNPTYNCGSTTDAHMFEVMRSEGSPLYENMTITTTPSGIYENSTDF